MIIAVNIRLFLVLLSNYVNNCELLNNIIIDYTIYLYRIEISFRKHIEIFLNFGKGKTRILWQSRIKNIWVCL